MKCKLETGLRFFKSSFSIISGNVPLDGRRLTSFIIEVETKLMKHQKIHFYLKGSLVGGRAHTLSNLNFYTFQSLHTISGLVD